MSNSNQGFSLVEVILAASIFALLLTALVGVFIIGQDTARISGDRARATFIAEEGLEVVRNIRDADFSNLSDGTFGLSNTSGTWGLTGAYDDIDRFRREITISTISEDVKKVESTVTWEQNSRREGQINLVTRLSNWQKEKGSQGNNSNPDGSGVNICCGNKQVRGITLENTGEGEITLETMTMSWDDNSVNLSQIFIDNSSVWPPAGPTPDGSPSQTFDIEDVVLSSGQVSDISPVKFDGNISGNELSIIFNFSDGSSSSLSLSF